MTVKPEGVWIERFEGCAPPPQGATYQVLDQHWDTDAEPLVRTIRRYRVVAGPSRTGKARVTPEALRLVASVVDHARSQGQSPVMAVKDRLSVGTRAAQLWIARARTGVDPDTDQPYLAG